MPVKISPMANAGSVAEWTRYAEQFVRGAIAQQEME